MIPLLEEGRRKTAFLLCGAFTLAAIVLVLITTQRASATGDSMIGIDMSPGAGTSSSDITSCARVQEGDSFEADIFVSNAQNLVNWELRVDFDPDVVSLESADYSYFLTQSGGGIAGQTFDSEAPGRRFLAAGEPHGDSGSGVLARLHLIARSEGISALSITSSPTFLGPKLQSAENAPYPDFVPFSDFNGDTIFDGALSGATVAVGRSCGASTPVVTPSPAPTGGHATATPKPSKTPTPAAKTPAPGVTIATPTPRPSGVPGTTATEPPGNGGADTDESDSNPVSGGGEPTPRPSEFVIDAPGSEPGDVDGDDSDGSSSSEGNSPDDTSNGDGPAQASSGGSGSTTLILIIAGALAALCVLLGTTFLLVRGSRKQ